MITLLCWLVYAVCALLLVGLLLAFVTVGALAVGRLLRSARRGEQQ